MSDCEHWYIYSNSITQYSFWFPTDGPPTLFISVTGETYLSNSINITCFVPTKGKNFSTHYTSLKWMKDGRNFDGDPSAEVTISMLYGTMITRSIIRFPSLQLNHSGLYKCAATPIEEQNPALPLSDSIYLNVFGKQFVITSYLYTN